MRALTVAGRCALALLLVAAGHRVALAQAAPAAQPPAAATPVPYEPTEGQQGKDVVWVPTHDSLVQKMLDLAKVTADDYVMDLGSGDGRTVIAAAKRGATAQGIEYNPDMVALSKARAAEAGVGDRASFANADLFTTDFSKATVLTMFLLPDINERLMPQILALKPGTRVVSNTFRMGAWEPDREETIADCTSWCTALLWIVPAKVAGTWDTPAGVLTLEQQYQMVTGTLGSTPITGGRVRGSVISFQAGDAHYSGRVEDGVIEGLVNVTTSDAWMARRR
jgi:SAM-dependent methyltransferase